MRVRKSSIIATGRNEQNRLYCTNEFIAFQWRELRHVKGVQRFAKTSVSSKDFKEKNNQKTF